MKKVLFLGCHCDDIELGCGGTIHKHRNDWQMRACTFSPINPDSIDLRNISSTNLTFLGVEDISFGDLSTRVFSSNRQKIWETCKKLEKDFDPDIVFFNAFDGHQDHNVLHEEVKRNIFKNSLFSYRVQPGYEKTNYIETLSRDNIESKLKVLSKYEVCKNKPYFRSEIIISRSYLSGYLAGVEYGESFEVIRMVK